MHVCEVNMKIKFKSKAITFERSIIKTPFSVSLICGMVFLGSPMVSGLNYVKFSFWTQAQFPYKRVST